MKKMYVVNLILLGSIFVSCKTSKVQSSKPRQNQARTETVTTTKQVTKGPAYVPWKKDILVDWASKLEKKPAVVVNSEEIRLWNKPKMESNFTTAVTKQDTTFSVVIPAKTPGIILDFFVMDSVMYHKVLFTLKDKDSTQATVFWKEEHDGTFSPCINDKFTDKNIVQAVYKGRALPLSHRPAVSQKKCILLIPEEIIPIEITIGGN
jgi:phosphorylcholine metabolism protein LicD